MVVPPDTPTCRIKGIIKNVKFEGEQIYPNADDDSALLPPGVMHGTTSPAQFRLRVLVQEITYVSGSENRETCKERYKKDDEDIFFIYQSEVKAGDDFLEEQVIEGEVWNGYFKSYTLI
jgi:hypothetical protein